MIIKYLFDDILMGSMIFFLRFSDVFTMNMFNTNIFINFLWNQICFFKVLFYDLRTKVIWQRFFCFHVCDRKSEMVVMQLNCFNLLIGAKNDFTVGCVLEFLFHNVVMISLVDSLLRKLIKIIIKFFHQLSKQIIEFWEELKNKDHSDLNSSFYLLTFIIYQEHFNVWRVKNGHC